MTTDTYKIWHDQLLKSFKVDDQEKLEQKFHILSHEGLSFSSLKGSEKTYFLESFPEKSQFCRIQKAGPGDDEFPILSENFESELLTTLEKNNFEKASMGKKAFLNLAPIQQSGGNAVSELVAMLSVLFHIPLQEVEIMFALDSQVFYQVAKLRAARVLLESIHSQVQPLKFKLVATPSLSQFTSFERTSLMLRNTAAVSAAMMGGADFIAVDNLIDPEDETFWRQTRNTFHVLNEESQLARVKDPGAGSELVESLTNYLVDSAYEKFLEIKESGLAANFKALAQECSELAKRKQEIVESRKHTIVGVNNYSDLSETLDELPELVLFSDSKSFPIRRPSERIEKLRFGLQDKSLSPVIYSFGDLKSIFDRVMFAKNFFEVTGKETHHIHRKEFECEAGDESHLIICALDEDYEKVMKNFKTNGKPVFIISRDIILNDCTNVYRGLNIVEFLTEHIDQAKDIL